MDGGGAVPVGRAPEADPFGTAALRRGVLDGWTASAARFREDANAEQDLVLGGYRDRLVVELAQNAADAAARAGVAGRLRLTLADGVLVAANTGAPLDAEGVASLATLRASAKRDEAGGERAAVGRFGVGFAAVLAVSDEPAVVSRTGGVRWSLGEARELTAERGADAPQLHEELARRDGHVPLLRLPLPAEGAPPEEYETAVVLPLRDAAAEELALRLLEGVDDALLLTLPGLAEVAIEVPEGTGPQQEGPSLRTLTRTTEEPGQPAESGEAVLRETRIDDVSPRGTAVTRWRTASLVGEAGAELLADRPLEERLRPQWSVTWAVPVGDDGGPLTPRTVPRVHAPTPTDEPQGLPALLIASFPLEPTRRRVAPGPLTEYLVERAAECYTDLLRGWRTSAADILDLVPGQLGTGELDGEVRASVLRRLPATAFLAGAAREDGAPVVLRPRDAELVEGAGAATVEVLAELFPALLPAGLEHRSELRVLEVPRIPLADVVDRLAGVERGPEWWWRLYDSLAGVDPDRLSGLPVPLADGRTTIGPRHVLLPQPPREGVAESAEPARLAGLGLKVAHVAAAHPLLEKLGATLATPRSVLTTPQVRAAVAGSLDADEIWHPEQQGPDAEELAGTVLALVRDAGLQPGDEPWLAALALPDEEGELAPAGELVYPGSRFQQVIREGELGACDAGLAEEWGEQPLTAVGVQAEFALVRARDVVLDPDELEPRDTEFAESDDPGLLDAVDVWCEDALDQLPEYPLPPVAAELVAVRDLDLVDDGRWPQALEMLSEPPLREALTEPVRVLPASGPVANVRGYTAWWLRGHPVLDGRRPAGLRTAGGDPLLSGLYEEVDTGPVADAGVLRALGVRTSASALLDEPGGAAELLTRLAEPERAVDAAQLHGLYGLLALLDPDEVTLPDELRAVDASSAGTLVVDASRAVVADAPDLLALAGDRPLLPVPPRYARELAELLEVDRLSRAVPGAVSGAGTEREVPAQVRVVLPEAPASYFEYDELRLDGVESDWRVTPDGAVHAATFEGLAAGLAWRTGLWSRRFETAALLEDPSRDAELARARWFD
ncbi:sacsin N-terminal ATP-binding-like domain-containing protein [Streptomyces xiaopingdaonensis]|uniref:sacsin N-terminal ATP-binding-like domain-containing protein n=1 Tax=Streptomyces xiaopingdaonensis TaxID=1565415 RepID=UPI0002FDED0E|nr:hypothetical protein [Streptomyces xiaopingdaonensis]